MRQDDLAAVVGVSQQFAVDVERGKVRSLVVYAGGVTVGALHEGDDLWRFEYDEGWRAAAVSREAGIRGDDAFALLEYLGAETAGALTLLPPGAPLPGGQGLQVLDDATLSARIAALPSETLGARAPKRMSLAGAQHKALVVLEGGRLYEPVGATPSTHILKPEHPLVDTYPASVANGFLTMRMAHAAALAPPPVFIRDVPQPVYLVERFDRVVTLRGAAGNGTPLLRVRRRHVVDACQLLGKARAFKHSGASLAALDALIKVSTNKLDTVSASTGGSPSTCWPETTTAT